MSPRQIDELPIICFGECMVELRPNGGEDGLWQQSYAGDTCNTAVYMSRLLKNRQSSRVGWVMGFGDDVFAEPLQKFLLGQGLDLSLSQVLDGGTTGLYAIRVDQSGERHFSYWRNTSAARSYFENSHESVTPLEQAIPQIQGLHFSGISLAILNEASRARLLEAARKLKQYGGWVSFDTNYRQTLWSSTHAAKAAMLEAMKVADRILLSIDEWLLVTGTADEVAAIKELRQLKCAELVIKRGAKDTLLVLQGEDMTQIPVQGIEQPIDTTGAGDAFAGAYLAARVLKKSPMQAAAIGNQLAAAVVMHSGAIIDIEDMPVLKALN